MKDMTSKRLILFQWSSFDFVFDFVFDFSAQVTSSEVTSTVLAAGWGS